ncbi:hypothetical protein C7S17_6973 [Burkholderia thailandensis]|nr:hypothetical protein [Burkholderia thailandensis]
MPEPGKEVMSGPHDGLRSVDARTSHAMPLTVSAYSFRARGD